MQNLVDDSGEIFERVIKSIADFFSFHSGQTEPQDKSQHNSGQGIHDRRDGQAEIGLYGDARSCRNLFQRFGAHEMRKQRRGYEIGAGSCDQRGQIGQKNGDDQKLSCALRQICNSHGYIREDHERYDKFQKRTEYAGQGDNQTADRLRQKLSDEDTDDDRNDQFWNKSQFPCSFFHL